MARKSRPEEKPESARILAEKHGMKPMSEEAYKRNLYRVRLRFRSKKV